MIPPPKLDDRTLNDIVEDAISLIPRYSPDGRNHTPSVTGIPLTERAAWRTDTPREVVVTSALAVCWFTSLADIYSAIRGFRYRAPGTVSEAFEVFVGAQRIERYMYISDPRCGNAGEASLLRVYLGTHERGG